jgi:hypothetical protein
MKKILHINYYLLLLHPIFKKHIQFKRINNGKREL